MFFSQSLSYCIKSRAQNAAARLVSRIGSRDHLSTSMTLRLKKRDTHIAPHNSHNVHAPFFEIQCTLAASTIFVLLSYYVYSCKKTHIKPPSSHTYKVNATENRQSRAGLHSPSTSKY